MTGEFGEESLPPPPDAPTDPAPAPTANDLVAIQDLLIAINARLDKISGDASHIAAAVFDKLGEIEGVQTDLLQKLDDAVEVGGRIAVRVEALEHAFRTLADEYMVLDHRTSDHAGAVADNLSRMPSLHGEEEDERARAAGEVAGE